MNIGTKRTQVTIAIEGPFNSPPLYANVAEATDPWVDIVLPPYALKRHLPARALESHERNHAPLAREPPRAQKQGGEMPDVDPMVDTGDCLLADYRLMHAGNADHSPTPRPILYNMYCRPWFRDSRNYRQQRPIRISREEYLRVPREFRFLFNWWRR